jgi:hypothetical protein
MNMSPDHNPLKRAVNSVALPPGLAASIRSRLREEQFERRPNAPNLSYTFVFLSGQGRGFTFLWLEDGRPDTANCRTVNSLFQKALPGARGSMTEKTTLRKRI